MVFIMASRSAIVLVVLIVALIAFCFAGVFAAMTGTYHLNLNFGNNTNATPFFGNSTAFNSEGDSSDSGSHVQTYSDSGSSSGSVETKEDTNPTPAPTPEPSPTPEGGGGSKDTCSTAN